jgi:hypothetical protein
MLDWLMGILRDHACASFVDAKGRSVDVDFDVLEETTEWWWKDLCVAPAPHIRCRVKQVARQRMRVLAAILSIAFPFQVAMWAQAATDRKHK